MPRIAAAQHRVPNDENRGLNTSSLPSPPNSPTPSRRTTGRNRKAINDVTNNAATKSAERAAKKARTEQRVREKEAQAEEDELVVEEDDTDEVKALKSE